VEPVRIVLAEDIVETDSWEVVEVGHNCPRQHRPVRKNPAVGMGHTGSIVGGQVAHMVGTAEVAVVDLHTVAADRHTEVGLHTEPVVAEDILVEGRVVFRTCVCVCVAS